jgi:hypothetical protein
MKKNKTKIISLCIVIVGVGAIVFFMSRKSEAPAVTNINTQNNTTATNVPEVSSNETASNDIIITSPTNNQAVSSGTLKVSGTARGNWYFEASAPFDVEDSNNNVIETSSITAQGEWTTTDFVPFTGEITFTVPKGMKSGFIVFHNDNPSGDPANEKSVSVPVIFK